MLRSFHNDPEIKARYLARLHAHAAADEIVRGYYWTRGKGCAVGCTIHGSDHAAYEVELGLPEWLARLEDRLFEGLNNEAAKDFAVDFLAAIPVGVSLERVRWQFCLMLLQETKTRMEGLVLPRARKKEIIGFTDQVAALHTMALRTGQWPESIAGMVRGTAQGVAKRAWKVVWAAADSAFWSAAWGVECAAGSAESTAQSAARSAECAARSAECEVGHAEFAARRGATVAAYKRYADYLLALLQQAR